MSMGDIPAFDPDAERWGVNRLMLLRYGGDFDHWTRWFDLHSTAHIQRHRPEAYCWYQQQNGRRPIYQWAVDPTIPGSTVYPLDTVRPLFEHDAADFSGSLSWMLALALAERFDDIDLFWFTMTDPEHQRHIASARYWIGYARGRGCRVTIHGDSGLTPSGPLYGLETT